MPYCTSCGTEVSPQASFCGHCGTAQLGASRESSRQSAPLRASAPTNTVGPRTASILCYIPIFGVIPAIIVLASHRFRGNVKVRFDAFQSVYLFVAWLIVSTAMPIVEFGFVGGHFERFLLGLLKLAFFICWIFLLVKAAQEQQVHLPVIGDLAARSTSEQV